METAWDWITLFIFSLLATLLLQRSSEASPPDKLWQYGPPAAGCAIANYLGNHEQVVPAVAVLLGVLIYSVVVLKPFPVKKI